MFFPTTYSQEDIEYIFHQFAYQLSLIEFEFNFDTIVELELNLYLFKYIEWISILYRKELVSFISTTFLKIYCSIMIFVVSMFSNVFSLGANKEDLLHVTHCIISSLLFG